MLKSIYGILQELNEENGTKYKERVLIKYKDNPELIRIFSMTYDTVKYNYGVGKTTLDKLDYEYVRKSKITISEALDILENEFASKQVSGNAAITRLQELFNMLNGEDQYVISKVIERDLRINIGKTLINKVQKGLITKPAYCRCSVYSEKTAKNINFPAYVQLKADGTYREFNVHAGHVTARSRSGESYEYPVIFEQMREYQDGIYIGELTIRGEKDRAKSNGLINSDKPPHNDIIVELWDYLTQDEYNLALEKDKKNPCTIQYKKRFEKLKFLLSTYMGKNIQLIPCKVVNNIKEALEFTSLMMNKGFEGSVLKDYDMVFKDGTSNQQLKLKLEISAEMRCTGFTDGTQGTKREGKVGAIIFSNDEGTIQGRCSGFTDKELDYFTINKEEFIGKIMEVQFNDLSKSPNNDYYALSHPRFIEWRNDKYETDSLEKVIQLKEMATNFS